MHYLTTNQSIGFYYGKTILAILIFHFSNSLPFIQKHKRKCRKWTDIRLQHTKANHRGTYPHRLCCLPFFPV
jgi:hypothetical protein